MRNPRLHGLRIGYWLPVFGGWLRNVHDEGMSIGWPYIRTLVRRSEELGYDLTLIAELNLNDIKGVEAPALDAWSTAAAVAAVTTQIEIMVAVRPTFHQPALLAKQSASLDQLSGGRLTLNVVSSWWAEEARMYGVAFDRHDERYARTSEWIDIVNGLWKQPRFSYEGRFYRVGDTILEPKPLARPRPCLYAGGESEAAKDLIAQKCDAYLMHGDPPERIAAKIADLRRRRADTGLPPLRFGVAAYAIVRETAREADAERARITDVRASAAGFANYEQWLAGTELERAMSIEEYSVSNRGLRSGLVGTPDQVAAQLERFAEAGVDLVLLQMSPQLEEMERFAASVMTTAEAVGARPAQNPQVTRAEN